MFRCLNVAVAECAMVVKAKGVTAGASHSGGRAGCDSSSGSNGSKTPVVTILMRDGHVLELPKRLKCADLLASYPDHAVCHASALVMRHKGQRLAADAYLEQGRLYFLLPKPAGRRVRQKQESASVAPAPDSVASSASSSTLKLVISKQHLAQIIAEAKAGAAEAPGAVASAKSTPPASAPHPRRPGGSDGGEKARPPRPAGATGMPVKRARSRCHWSAPLDTIAEASAATEVEV